MARNCVSATLFHHHVGKPWEISLRKMSEEEEGRGTERNEGGWEEEKGKGKGEMRKDGRREREKGKDGRRERGKEREK